MLKGISYKLAARGQGNEKPAVGIARVLWAVVMVLGIALPASGDHRKDYYPDPGLITVELEGQIVDYLPCERIALDYPGLVERCAVNMGRDNNGNTWAAVTGVSISAVKRLFRSRDGGVTWTSMQLVATQDRDLVAFTVLNNNNLVLATNLDNMDPRIYLSSDMGGTWTYTTGLKPDPYRYIGEGFLSLTQLSNGHILLPIARYDDDPYETGIFGSVFVSKDKGHTFPVVYSTFEFCGEAHVLELRCGDLLAAFRYQRYRLPGETDEEILSLGGNISPEQPFAFKNVFLGDSGDGGVTWNNFRPLRDSRGRVLIHYGQCHGQLVQVPDGRVVLVYDNRYPAEERDVRARVSKDAGQTWDPALYYLSFGLGNPASVVLDDGTIVTVTGNWPFGPTGPTGPPTARVIRWRLPPAGNTAAIEILSPTSLSRWPTGSQQKILWNSTNGISHVKIDLYKSHSLLTTIVSSCGNTGSYTWNIPSNLTAASDYKIKITDTADPSVYGESEEFSITRPCISLNRTQLVFGAVVNGGATGSQGVMISNSGSGTLNWSISTNASWLNCSPNSGTNPGMITVSVDPPGLSAGIYPGTITVSDPNASNSPQTISVTLNIYQSHRTSAPFGSYDTPGHDSTVSSSVPFTGWVLDDIGVRSVKLYREEGGSLVYIGDGVFVEGARPDVEQAYPGYPMNYRAGWGYMMLTNALPGGNGKFIIHAAAADVDGHQATLGKKTITVDNVSAVKPFGALDTPTQGGTASGSGFINWGWSLTPQPNRIPGDGSTINVYVDGINLGHPTYNIYRPDIAALFPSYANSDGASGYFYLDTGAYENGVHTIQWTVKDSGGNIDGIGSRYFTIQNTGAGSANKVKAKAENQDISQIIKLPVDFSMPIKVRRGFNENVEPIPISPDKKGISRIVIRELERVEVWLSNETTHIYGYMTAGNRLYPLPVGSTPGNSGIFYWQSGPGFIGEYPFVFIIKDDDGNITRKNIIINIIPRFSKQK